MKHIQTATIAALVLMLLFSVIGQNRDPVWIFGFASLIFCLGLGVSIVLIAAVYGFYSFLQQWGKGLDWEPAERRENP